MEGWFYDPIQWHVPIYPFVLRPPPPPPPQFGIFLFRYHMYIIHMVTFCFILQFQWNNHRPVQTEVLRFVIACNGQLPELFHVYNSWILCHGCNITDIFNHLHAERKLYQGRRQDFHLEGAQNIMCAHAHYDRETQIPFWQGYWKL